MPCSIMHVNSAVYNHIIANSPPTIEKQSLIQRTNNGKFSGPFNVCPSCFAYVDFWSKDLYKVLDKQQKDHNYKVHQEKAKNLELAGRYEDAAKEYEHLEMWEDAGRVRREGSTQVVKTVNVDLNRLMDDLRRGGLALNYKCHSCGGGVTIGSGGMDAPKFCPYCGVMIDTKTLSDMLKTALR